MDHGPGKNGNIEAIPCDQIDASRDGIQAVGRFRAAFHPRELDSEFSGFSRELILAN